MPETSTAKRLAIGNLSTTLASLYTVPANTVTRITHLRICTATTDTVTLIHNDGTSDYNLLSSFSIEANSYEDLFDLILESGDALKGQATVVGDADYVIYGIETETT